MPVLVEALSVIVRKSAIEEKFEGGWTTFVDMVPNRTLCFDDDLARVGFMSSDDVRAYVDELFTHGLQFLVNDQAQDIAVLDQLQGFMVPAPWLELANQYFEDVGGKVVVCRLHGSNDELVAVPARWKFAGSISERGGFVPRDDSPGRLKFIRTDDGIDVFHDEVTGQEVYTGRTSRTL